MGVVYFHFVNDFWNFQLSPVGSLDDIMLGVVPAVSLRESTQVIYKCIFNGCPFHSLLVIHQHNQNNHESNLIEKVQNLQTQPQKNEDPICLTPSSTLQHSRKGIYLLSKPFSCLKRVSMPTSHCSSSHSRVSYPLKQYTTS